MNDLLSGPEINIIDPEINESRVHLIQENEEEVRNRRVQELELRRKQALKDIAEVGQMMEMKKKMEGERMELVKALSQERLSLDSVDLSLAPSSRSLSWWRRLSPGYRQSRERFRDK